MKKYILALLLSSLSLGSASVLAGDLAAKVNGSGISKLRLDAALDSAMKQSGSTVTSISDPDEFANVQKDVLDQLIVQEMLWLEAESKKTLADDAEVDKALEQMKSQFPSPDVFIASIQKGGFTEEAYRMDIKKRLSVRDMIKQEIIDTVKVEDSEIDEFYNANTEKMMMPDEIHARHILIKLAPTANEEHEKAAKEMIEKVLKQARDGGDFAELAKKHSEGPSGEKGGDLGYFGRGRMVAEFEQVAFALKDGDISDPVRTQFGYHIIKREATRGGEKVTREQATNQIRDYLKSIKIKESIDKLISELRAQSEIEILL